MGTNRWSIKSPASLRLTQFAGLAIGLYGLWQAAVGGGICWEQWERDGRLPVNAVEVGLSLASLAFGTAFALLAPFLWFGYNWARITALGLCLWQVGMAVLWALEPFDDGMPAVKQFNLRVSGVGVFGLIPAVGALFLANARVIHEFRGGTVWWGDPAPRSP